MVFALAEWYGTYSGAQTRHRWHMGNDVSMDGSYRILYICAKA